jgi:hypothetical protein
MSKRGSSSQATADMPIQCLCYRTAFRATARCRGFEKKLKKTLADGTAAAPSTL